VKDIFTLELAKVKERLEGKKLKLEVTAGAKEHLIEIGFDSRTGARGIRRVLEEKIEDPISEMIILDQIKPGELAQLQLENGILSMKILDTVGTTDKRKA
jgi:ATP-dependent Clp protease ATP-binding subunit ClpC